MKKHINLLENINRTIKRQRDENSRINTNNLCQISRNTFSVFTACYATKLKCTIPTL